MSSVESLKKEKRKKKKNEAVHVYCRLKQIKSLVFRLV